MGLAIPAAAVRADLRRPDRSHPDRLLSTPSGPIPGNHPAVDAGRARGHRLQPGLDAFYWAWWISWSPFVGMFIARVSRGRTVREFIICVLLIPSFRLRAVDAVFGGTAMSQFVNDGGDGRQTGDRAAELSLFEMLERAAAGNHHLLHRHRAGDRVLRHLVGLRLAGDRHDHRRRQGRRADAAAVFWCTFEGLVAIALLLGGGLGALQAMAVSTGFPFTIVLLLDSSGVVRLTSNEKRGG
jgi:BCCT family betaine/carnitine transporter